MQQVAEIKLLPPYFDHLKNIYVIAVCITSSVELLETIPLRHLKGFQTIVERIELNLTAKTACKNWALVKYKTPDKIIIYRIVADSPDFTWLTIVHAEARNVLKSMLSNEKSPQSTFHW